MKAITGVYSKSNFRFIIFNNITFRTEKLRNHLLRDKDNNSASLGVQSFLDLQIYTDLLTHARFRTRCSICLSHQTSPSFTADINLLWSRPVRDYSRNNTIRMVRNCLSFHFFKCSQYRQCFSNTSKTKGLNGPSFKTTTEIQLQLLLKLN
jgi:hypothetical protein